MGVNCRDGSPGLQLICINVVPHESCDVMFVMNLMRHGAMFRRPKAAALHAPAPRALVDLLVVGLAMFMMASSGPAQAYAPGQEPSAAIGITHKTTAAVAIMAPTFASELACAISQDGEPCCGSGAQSHHANCVSGCCSACPATGDVASAGFVLLDGPTGHLLPRHSGVVSTRPPPEFRPPRILA